MGKRSGGGPMWLLEKERGFGGREGDGEVLATEAEHDLVWLFGER